MYAATFKPTVVAPFARGWLYVEYQSSLASMFGSIVSSAPQRVAAGPLPATRGNGQHSRAVTVTNLTPFVQYHHRACYVTYVGGVVPTTKVEKCSSWRTFTPS
jgi:hypothetical protein